MIEILIAIGIILLSITGAMWIDSKLGKYIDEILGGKEDALENE